MRTLLAAAVLLAAVAGVASAHGGVDSDRADAAAEWTGGAVAPSEMATANASATDPEPLVEVVEEGRLWPYTSKRPSPDGRTLAINVVVRGRPSRVRTALLNRGDLVWNRTGGDALGDTYEVEVAEPGIEWGGNAHGAARYSYVRTGDGARWVDAGYQLQNGPYLGERHHVRAYPTAEWTALQAHREYWDWFRLRHSVTAVAPAAGYLESDLKDEPFVADYRRTHHGHRGGGSAGVIGVVVLGSAVAAARVGDAVDRLKREVRRADLPGAVALAGGVAAVHAGVRLAGVALEGRFPGVSPKVFVALLYPALVAGVPLVAVRLGRKRRPAVAFVAAAAGLGGAVVADFAALEVVRVPDALLWSRVYLVAATGGLAAGGSYAGRGDRRLLAVAGLAWAVALAVPLFEL